MVASAGRQPRCPDVGEVNLDGDGCRDITLSVRCRLVSRSVSIVLRVRSDISPKVVERERSRSVGAEISRQGTSATVVRDEKVWGDACI